jgi:hypothetical protein
MCLSIVRCCVLCAQWVDDHFVPAPKAKYGGFEPLFIPSPFSGEEEDPLPCGWKVSSVLSTQIRGLATLGFFSKMAQRFPDAYSEAANDPANAASLKAVTVKQNVESAADLWLSTFLKHDQWNKAAKALNSRMAQGGKNQRWSTPVHTHHDCLFQEV